MTGSPALPMMASSLSSRLSVLARGRRPASPADGGEACLRAFSACFAAEGDGQVRLARAGRPEQDHVLVPPGEFERLERLAPVIDREADRRPVVPVEFLGLGKPGLSQQARAFRAPAGRDLLAHPCLHERHLRRGRLLQAVGEDLPGRRQAAREFHDRLHPAPGRGAPAPGVLFLAVSRARAMSPFPSRPGLLNLS